MKLATVNLAIRIGAWVTTLILVPLLSLRYYWHFKLVQGKGLNKPEALFLKSSDLWWLMADILVHLSVPVPAIEFHVCYPTMARSVCNFLCDFLMLVGMLRILQIVRLLCHFSQWQNNHSTDIW